jgi:glycosyltransferase involved in cell wall biosynthesis
MTIDLTALILTFNEQENIARTLAALPPLHEVVLIDSFSTDGTVEIAKAARPNVRVLQREFDTHTEQWNFGLDQVTTQWALTLDADYELSPELQSEISRLEPSPDVVGYSAEFVYKIFGHPLRASSYPPRVVLFRKSQARYIDDGHTQTLWFYSASRELRPPTQSYPGKPAASPTEETGRIEKLAGKIYHDDRKPLSHWIQAQDRYAKLEARHLLSRPLGELNFQDRLRRKIFFAAPAMFFYLLFARGLILDGWPGWFYVAQRTIAELLLSMRLLIESEALEDRDGGS